jgi:endoglucanase
VDVSVSNTGTATFTGWTITLTFPETTTITNSWNTTFTPPNGTPGTSFTAINCNGCSWQVPGPGTTASNVFGFQGTHDGSFTGPTCTAVGK